MSNKVTYTNLERQASLWQIYNDPSVNPQPMDDVRIQSMSDGMCVYMRGHLGPNGEYPGALVARKLKIPTIPDTILAYSGLDYEVYFEDVSLLAASEGDLKNCWTPAPNPNTQIANVMDGSAQLLQSGAWQIDNAVPKWVDTGFKPGLFTAGTWSKVSTRQKMNSDGTFSFLSITDRGKLFTLPPQNLPLVQSNWGTVLAVQFQIDIFAAGFVVAKYRNVNVTVSDEAF